MTAKIRRYYGEWNLITRRVRNAWEMIVKLLSALSLAAVLASCSSLPRPEVGTTKQSEESAERLLRESSKKSGDPYQRLSRVDVSYDGDWAKFATKIQPAITDPGYRKMSEETYLPRQSKVLQVYNGLEGEKRVTRTPKKITVTRNGKVVANEEELFAAALVADCYVVFTFGSSALIERGSGWHVIGKRHLGGEQCALVAGTVKPGFGMSADDGVIAWIGEDTKRLYRVQLTLFGLESTAGADVDVTYGDFQSGPYGTEWPRYFNERIRRPFDVQVHEWRMTELKVRR